jgi:hypothetical protein
MKNYYVTIYREGLAPIELTNPGIDDLKFEYTKYVFEDLEENRMQTSKIMKVSMTAIKNWAYKHGYKQGKLGRPYPPKTRG